MNKQELLNSVTLMAQAYAFAKAGNEEMAGKLFVEASANDALDDVMEGIASGAEKIEADAYEDLPDDANEPDTTPEDSTKVEASVELPESVARLAARTLV